MLPSLVDTCVNLLNGQFRRDREAVVMRAREQGVRQIIITATDLESAAAAQALADPPHSYCTAGVHPHDVDKVCTEVWQDRLIELARHDAVVAVGETGLDFNRNYSQRDHQIDAFKAQIALAKAIDKPLFVHDREAAGTVLACLLEQQPLPDVVIHCFTGTQSELTAYIDAGFYIGITGWIADKRRGNELREIVHQIPVDRLLIETDAPFLLPQNLGEAKNTTLVPVKGKRNEPALLPFVLRAIASVRDEDYASLARATTANARRLFNLAVP